MKLPEGLRFSYTSGDQQMLVEAIVRDCAETIADQIPNWCGPGQARLLELVARDILARYGLKENEGD